VVGVVHVGDIKQIRLGKMPSSRVIPPLSLQRRPDLHPGDFLLSAMGWRDLVERAVDRISLKISGPAVPPKEIHGVDSQRLRNAI
jgi:hypothetical protein